MVPIVRTPYRIFQEVIDDCVRNKRQEVAYEYIISMYLKQGYGLERARYWLDLYLDRFCYDQKGGFILVR